MTGMRIDSRFLNWGVFFILLGLVPLAVQQGWIPDDAVSGWWRFWPLILIGIGVGLLLRHTAAHFLGGTLVAATCGLMFGSLVAAGVGGNIGFACDQNRPGTPFAGQSGTLSGNSAVELVMNCGNLVTTPNPGSGWSLTGSGPDGQVPRVTAEATQLTIKSPDEDFLKSLDSAAESWTVGLPVDQTRSVSATLNAGSARLGLGGLQLDSLSMTTNAGDTRIDLSSSALGSLSYTLNAGNTRIALPSSSLSGSATVNAGNLGLCVPSGVGLRVQLSSFLASDNFAEHGLVQSGSTWTSPGYDTATAKIDLSMTANAGTIELDPSGGCQ